MLILPPYRLDEGALRSKENGPDEWAIFRLVLLVRSVVPVVVTPNDYVAVAIVMVPTAMPPVVVPIEFGARTIVIVVAIVFSVAADAEAKPLSACDCRRSNHEGRERGKNVSKVSHVPSPIVSCPRAPRKTDRR
jgi:hypothetical protein